MNRSTPGLLVHHQLLEFIKTHVHWVSDAIQPCHPLSSPSPPALNLSQHQGLFKWVSPSHQMANRFTWNKNIHVESKCKVYLFKVVNLIIIILLLLKKYFFILIGGWIITILWWVLLYISMNRPWVHMCPEHSSQPPPHPMYRKYRKVLKLH